MRKYILFLTLTIVLYGCMYAENNHWHYLKATGMLQSNESIYDLLMVNDKVVLAFGSNWKPSDVLENKLNINQEAVIYRTDDGGNNWKPYVFGKGEFGVACINKDIIYAVKRVYWGEIVGQVDSSYIYMTKDLGITWSIISKIPYYINRIQFYSSEKGVFDINSFGKYSDNHIFTTNNGGLTWDSLGLQCKVIRHWTSSSKGYFYYLATENNSIYSNNSLRVVDLTNGIEVKEIFSGFKAIIVENDNNENLWFLGDNEHEVQLWRRNSPNSFSEIKVFSSNKPIFSENLYVYNNVVMVLFSELYDGHVEYKLYRSDDEGETWREEYPPINYKMYPISFYQEGIGMISIGGGRIQRRN